MNIERTKTNKALILSILLAVLVIGTVFAVAYKKSWWPFSYFQSSDIQERANDDRFESDRDQAKILQEDPEMKEEAPNTDHPTAPNESNNSSKKQVQMVASVDQSNGTVFIRGGVNYPVTDGSCYAQLSGPSGQSVRIDSTILPNPGSTDCKTIQVAAGDLSNGEWTFVLHYTSNEFEGASNEVSFTI